MMKLGQLLWLPLLVLLVVLGACKSEPVTAPRTVEVLITLSEFKIESPMTRFAKGVPYRFTITNKGQLPHELMVVSPLSGHMAMEEMHQMALLSIKEDHLPPGASSTAGITFDKSYAEGEMELACHLPGHYDTGMRLPIRVD